MKLLAFAQGCPGPAALDEGGQGAGAGNGAANGSGTGAGAGSGAQTGLPCDIATILATNCLGCHSNPPVGGAPNPLVTYADLTATSSNGGTMADRSIIRMKDATAPMPPAPSPAVSAADIAAFEAWVDGCMPMGDCGGAGGAGPSPYDTPEVCSSNDTWTGGDEGSNHMFPGRACINCHDNPPPGADESGPTLLVAGTVYPTAHEPDDCNGVNGGGTTTVEITDANDNVFTLAVNAVGNFMLEPDQGSVTLPIRATVRQGDKLRAMTAAVPSGDCNSCHTLQGSGNPKAPGRIMAP